MVIIKCRLIDYNYCDESQVRDGHGGASESKERKTVVFLVLQTKKVGFQLKL
jgi:hypothetical protein